MHSNMLRAAKVTFFSSQLTDTVGYDEIYRRFRNIHNYLDKNEIVGDGENNLVVLDYQPNTHFSKDNFYGHFLFGIEGLHVQHVISNGKLIVKDRQVTTINEAEIKIKAQELSQKLWARMGSLSE